MPVTNVKPVRRRTLVRRAKARVARTQSETQATLLNGIVRVLGRRRIWNGSMTELGNALGAVVDETVEEFANPRSLRSRVDNLVRVLRSVGIKTRFGRMTDHSRKRFVQFTRYRYFY